MKNISTTGFFVISIDFELFWGLRDIRTLESYKENLIGVWEAIPKILNLFEKHNIHATWSSVGLLFCKDIEHAKKSAPTIKPQYNDLNLDAYHYLNNCKNLDPKFHFAPELIEKIRKTPYQEISTHTFSHYYSLEKGQNIDSFKADIEAAIKIAESMNIKTNSIVFPRNQWNPDYLQILLKLGITSFRGNENSWFYKPIENEKQNIIRRIGRLVDTYINLTGHQTYSLKSCISSKPYNFPSSRFLRPYSKSLSFLDKLRIKRIKKSMKYAAKNNEIYHLWWHPHNFGINTDQNLEILKDILKEFVFLNKNFNMQSMTMCELSKLANQL